MRVGYFDFNILLDVHENILISDISYQTFVGTKPLCIRFHKIDDLLRLVLELDTNIYYYFVLKEIMQFLVGSYMRKKWYYIQY